MTTKYSQVNLVMKMTGYLMDGLAVTLALLVGYLVGI